MQFFHLFSESLNRRLALGETQAKLSSDADAKQNEQISLRVKEHTVKAKKDTDDQLAKKKKREAELQEFYKSHVRHIL